MKKCVFCGADISDESKKCPSCGKVQPEYGENPLIILRKDF